MGEHGTPKRGREEVLRFAAGATTSSRGLEATLWTAGKRVLLLLFLMEALYYLGILEALARGITRPGDVSLLIRIVALAPAAGLAAFAVKKRSSRLGFALGWTALLLGFLGFPLLTEVWGFPMWIGAWASPAFGIFLVSLTLLASGLSALLIAVGRDPENTSKWAALTLLLVLGMGLTIRGGLTSINGAFLKACGVVMVWAMPVYMARRIRILAFLLSLSGMLFFGSMLFLNLVLWQGGVYSKHLIIGLSRVTTLGLAFLVVVWLMLRVLEPFIPGGIGRLSRHGGL